MLALIFFVDDYSFTTLMPCGVRYFWNLCNIIDDDGLVYEKNIILFYSLIRVDANLVCSVSLAK